MPRPLRIEYEDAYYHVMNRGRGRKHIFHGENYFKAFLKMLDEAHQRLRLLSVARQGVIEGIEQNIDVLSLTECPRNLLM